MKKLWTLAVLTTLVLASGLHAEDKAPKEAKPPTPKQISQEMAETWCAKMDECAKEKSMSIKECQKILFSSFKRGFDRLPKEQPLNLERGTLDQCKESIGSGSCDSLKGAKALPSCEFISRLGAMNP
ncbi:MAG: hypothetical protein U1F66_11445 [bacterium]